jgi:3-methyl-2-oxobutanoate hydroxymethyltransferase
MKPTTVTHLRQWKQEQRKFASLTAYDASFAKLFEEQGVKVLLVGDSLGMTLQGHDSTLPVTVARRCLSYSRRPPRRPSLSVAGRYAFYELRHATIGLCQCRRADAGRC